MATTESVEVHASISPLPPAKKVRLEDDFYQAVNAEWLEKNPVPADQGMWGNFNVLNEEMQVRLKGILDDIAGGTFDPSAYPLLSQILLPDDMKTLSSLYLSGINIAKRDEASLDYIYNSWVGKVINNVDNKIESIFEFLGKMHQAGIGCLFHFTVGIDDKMPTKHCLDITQSGLHLSSNMEYYTKMDQKSIELRAKYLTMIHKMTDIVVQKYMKGWIAPEYRLFFKPMSILHVETELALASKKPEDMRDPEKNYNIMKISALKSRYSNIPWDIYFKAYGFAQGSLKDDDDIIVEQLEFLDSVNWMLVNMDLKDLRGYMAWCCLVELAGVGDTRLMELSNDFYLKTMNGVQVMKPLWHRVLSQLNSTFAGEILGKLYAGKYFSMSARDKLNSMIDCIMEVYRERLQNSDWMSPETKVFALDKLSKIERQIGFPDKWNSDRFYDFKLTMNDLYVSNVVQCSVFDSKYGIAKLRIPVDRKLCQMTPQTINACYIPTFNVILFPCSICVEPFFSESASDPVNFGSICCIIGHEIGHAFDDQGSKYNGDGALQDWWTESDKKKFQLKVDQMIEHFNKIYVFKDIHINGNLTVGENIGDLTGLSVSEKAYKLYFEKNNHIEGAQPDFKTFFESWAVVWRLNITEQRARVLLSVDPHSPAKYRVNGILDLMEEFYQTFGIKEGDGMYCSERLVIW